LLEQRMIEVEVQRVGGAAGTRSCDLLAVEEPLEIRLAEGPAPPPASRSLAVTMRTPGHDAELAAGFLFSEGLVREPGDVLSIRPCGRAVGPLELRNVIRVELRAGTAGGAVRPRRNFVSSSSCGLCGKPSLDALAALPQGRLPDGFEIPAAVIHELPERLRRAQTVFERTGGLHAAALFDDQGRLCGLREDVGRHNAVDKLVGRAFLDGRLPLADRVICVSGRAGFELAQKAIAAGIPLLAAVGAPSSLAVELARRANLTLLGFVRDGRFNVYCGGHRILPRSADGPIRARSGALPVSGGR
jgi:FdhD protein